ncbi:hypothetical protein ACI79J_20185 [Geodermatophilus sp. SYSU D01062]
MTRPLLRAGAPSAGLLLSSCGTGRPDDAVGSCGGGAEGLWVVR